MRLKCFLSCCDAVLSAAECSGSRGAWKQGFGLALATVVFGALAWPALGQSVSVQDGCVVYTGADGKTRRLTGGGKDSDPALSPDGRRIVFVRGTPEQMVSAATGDVEASELRLTSVEEDARGPLLLLRGSESKKMENLLCDFSAPQFSPDGKTIYFLGTAWATSNALHAIDPATKKVRFVCAANGLEVVPSGEYRGKLIIQQHRYFLGGGSYDWHYLIEPNGKEIGIIGETTENFKETYSEESVKGKAGR